MVTQVRISRVDETVCGSGQWERAALNPDDPAFAAAVRVARRVLITIRARGASSYLGRGRPQLPTTLAGDLLQSLLVEDSKGASAVLDELFSPKRNRHCRNTGASHAQQARERLLRPGELIRMRPILHHQEPASQSCLNPMGVRADGVLRHLSESRECQKFCV
jgi:hypothetical protein